MRALRAEGNTYAAIARLYGRNPDTVERRIREGLPRDLSERRPKFVMRQCIGNRMSAYGPVRCKEMIKSTGSGHRMCFTCRNQT